MNTSMKANASLRNIDLNLLLVFDVIYRTRNTTRAAEQLHLTQPAVSNALKRLRDQFDDVLFVKTAMGMEPTPRADGIASYWMKAFPQSAWRYMPGRPSIPRPQCGPFISM